MAGHRTHMDSDKAHSFLSNPSVSTSLWAHLLRKEPLGPPPTQLDPVLPPLTPMDKNATSMRVLLHDTQANFEKFSTRVDNLCCTVDQAKREISTVNTLFQREHETLLMEIVDLVNRSQTQIQKSVGTPAQEQQVGQLNKDLGQRLDVLDQRLDAIQMFNQTHSHALQIQSQALQTLQDQQGTIIATLMPLLPLVQAIPLHIETARNHIKDFLAEKLTLHQKESWSVRAASPTAALDSSGHQKAHQGNKRSRTGPGLVSPSPSTKRPRTDNTASEVVTTKKNSDASIPNGRNTTEEIEGIQPSPANLTVTPQTLPAHSKSTKRTPEKIPGCTSPPETLAVKETKQKQTAHAHQPDPSSSPFANKTASAKVPPRLSRVHSTTASQSLTSLSNLEAGHKWDRSLHAQPATPSLSAALSTDAFDPSKTLVTPASSSGCKIQSLTAKGTATSIQPSELPTQRPVPIPRARTLKPSRSISSSSFGSSLLQVPAAVLRPRPRPPQAPEPSRQQRRLGSNTPRPQLQQPSTKANLQTTATRVAANAGHGDVQRLVRTSEQRSPVRTGRRFIPLDDDSDGDDPIDEIEEVDEVPTQQTIPVPKKCSVP